MNGTEYLSAVLAMNENEKKSLMSSESERRRTFEANSVWQDRERVTSDALAAIGFYYVGECEILSLLSHAKSRAKQTLKISAVNGIFNQIILVWVAHKEVFVTQLTSNVT